MTGQAGAGPSRRTLHPADERPVRGLVTPQGHKVTRAGIDRALDAHQAAGRIRSWWYSDRSKGVRTVLTADGPAGGLGDRDAYHLVLGLITAARARQADPGLAPAPGEPGTRPSSQPRLGPAERP